MAALASQRKKLKISLIAAKSTNGVIGDGPRIPWSAKGEQLIFKAITFNQWLLLGRKTYESMGKLPNRKYAVVSRSRFNSNDENVLVFQSIEEALRKLSKITDHVFVSGGGQIYKALINRVDTLHLSTIHQEVTGDVLFPQLPKDFKLVFEQHFESNIDYMYQIWQKS